MKDQIYYKERHGRLSVINGNFVKQTDTKQLSEAYLTDLKKKAVK